MLRCLLIYPEFPPSYWSGKYALNFIGKKAGHPPLGLITIAALFPKSYELKLVDMNIEPLSDEMLQWADYAFVSAMVMQQESFKSVVERCRSVGLPVIAGGPYPTSFEEEIEGVDHIVKGEVEDFFADFLALLEEGKAPRVTAAPIDECGRSRRPDITNSPVPRYDLLKLNAYVTTAVQFSRGCPYNCEFCDITALFGRVPRTKRPEQVLAELQKLYDLGWRNSVFFVDDNFIGNGPSVMALLPHLIEWQRARGYPFTFFTEASVNLAERPELMAAMREAGFNMVFLGIETPDPAVLAQTNKGQNIKQGNPEYLSWAVRTIQEAGMEVTAGFIVGFDGDDESCFQKQFDFIQSAGIPSAMVGLLSVLKGTDLYKRLTKEGRMLKESAGNNVSISINYVPKLDSEVLLNGYKQLLSSLYDPTLRNYFRRCYIFLERWNLELRSHQKINRSTIRAMLMSLLIQPFTRHGPAYLALLVTVLFRRPRMLAQFFRLAIVGYHYEKITRQQVIIDDFRKLLAAERSRLKELLTGAAARGGVRAVELQARLSESYEVIRARYKDIHQDYRSAVDGAVRSFHRSVEKYVSQLAEPFRPQMPALNV